jgi:hypothetical protein
MADHAYRIEHHSHGATVVLGHSDAAGVLGDVLAPHAARLFAARAAGVLTLVEQATGSIVAYRPLWPEFGDEEDAGAAGEPPIEASFPLRIDGTTYTRSEMISLCADLLVEAALNREPSVNPDPVVAGPIHNTRGFDIPGRQPAGGSRVRLGTAELLEVIAQARTELLRTLGYLPRLRNPPT